MQNRTLKLKVNTDRATNLIDDTKVITASGQQMVQTVRNVRQEQVVFDKNELAL